MSEFFEKKTWFCLLDDTLVNTATKIDDLGAKVH